MRRLEILLLALWLVLGLSGPAGAGEVTCLGTPILVISTATPGQDPDPAVDASCKLRYRKDSAAEPTLKITVATNLGSPVFSLEVEAINAGGGTSTGLVALGTTAQDLLTDITNTLKKTCDLRYVATALASDGTGTDDHTVTYTIVIQ
jgi:hypothetical protein